MMMAKRFRNITISFVFRSYCSLCSLSVKQKPLEAALNYRFKEPSYLEKALLHPSHPSATMDNQFERLEFLGDRVLNLFVAEFVINSSTDGKIGLLNNRFTSLISSESCLQIAKFIGLDSHLKAVYDKPKSKILADGVEALLGAVYLDGGFEACRAILTKSWIPFLIGAGVHKSRNIDQCKNDLQNWLLSQPEKILPRYVIEDLGNDSDPQFQCTVELGGKWPSFSGHGSSKKDAEKMAASAALDWIHAQDVSSAVTSPSSPSVLSAASSLTFLPYSDDHDNKIAPKNTGSVRSPKNELQEWMCQQVLLGGVGGIGPLYSVTETTTRPRSFKCRLELRQGLRPTFSGQGRTKKAAEARAAEAAMDWIQAQGVQGFYEEKRDYSFFRRGEEGSLLGSNVAYSDNYVVVGANGYSEFEGQVQVFNSINGSISHIANIHAPLNSIESSDFNIYGRNINFGVSTGIDEVNDSIIIGAIGYALHTGKAFIYVSNIDGVKVDDRWKLHTILDSPVQLMGHGFGYTVCIYDTFAVVGTTASTVYIYRLQTDRWNLVWTLSAENDPASAFGSSLSLYNRTLVIGDHGRGVRGGRVYVYTIKEVDDDVITIDLDNIFTENIEFESVTNFFGKSIQIHLDSLVIGAPHKLLDGQVTLQLAEPLPQPGAAYIYERTNGIWVNTANLSSLVDEQSLFGSSVSIRSNMAVVGAYAYGNNSGCAFWYRKDPISTQWDLTNSFPSPLYQNDSGFGYSVGVGVDSIAIGAYTQDQLRGAVYITSISRYGGPTLMPTTAGNGAAQTIFDAKGSTVTLTALSWLVLCFVFVLVIISIIVIGICCCCPNIFVFAAKKSDGKKERGQYEYGSGGIQYADMATVKLIATVDNSAERDLPVTDPWLAVSEVEETDFIVQGAGLVTNSTPPVPSVQGLSPTAGDSDLQLLHNHFVLSDPLEPAHLPPKRKANSNAIQKAATYFRNGIKRILPATESSYAIQERQLENSIFSDSNSGSPPPRPRPRSNSSALSPVEGTPRSGGRILPVTTSAYSLFKDQNKKKISAPAPDGANEQRKSFLRPAKIPARRLSKVNISPFSSFSSRHSQSSDASNISTLSLSSNSSMGDLSASYDMLDSNLPFDRSSNYRPSIAEPSFNNYPIPAPPPMYQVGRATANGGFALKDKNLPPLPSPIPSRRSDHTSPTNSNPKSPSKFPSIDQDVSANRPSALEVGLYNDYTNTKVLYQAFRKEVNAQMNFQLENLYDDESNCSSRSLMQNEWDDNGSVSVGCNSRSPSPVPFRSREQLDFHTPTKVDAGTGAKLSPLSKLPPISQPDVNYYLTSPEEREIHTQLRVETKARYLEFKAHVGSLLDESPSPNSSVSRLVDRKVPKVRSPLTTSSTPLTPRSSDSPVSVILSNSFYHTDSDDVLIMVDNEMRSALIQQQYPPMDEEVPMHTNALRFTEYREQYPPTQFSIPDEQNMLRKRVLQAQKLSGSNSSQGVAPPALTETISSGSNPERDNLRYRAAKANYKRFREKVDADKRTNDEHNSPT